MSAAAALEAARARFDAALDAHARARRDAAVALAELRAADDALRAALASIDPNYE